jgi:hypothetical protein
MRFAAQQHHEMTQLFRRKALQASDPAPMRRKANSFLALAKAASKQTPGIAGSIAPPNPPNAPKPALAPTA